MIQQTFGTLGDLLTELFRFYFPKRNTKSLDEFCDFVKDNNVEYVTVFGTRAVIAHTSDSASNEYVVRAVAVTPYGFVFQYKRLITSLSGSPELKEFWSSKRKLTIAVRTLGKMLTDSLPMVRVSVQMTSVDI